MVILQYHLTEEEYFDFNYYTSWAAPRRRGYRIRYYLRFLFWYVLIIALYLFGNRTYNLNLGAIIFGVVALAYFLMVPTLIKKGVRQRVRSTLGMPENKHVLEAAEVTIMDTGIIDKDTASETKYTWDAIVWKAETPTSYYLYTNSYHAIVIPKRVITNGQDRQELQRLLDQHLPLSSEFPDK